MHSDQYPYRELHDAMLDFRGGRFPPERLADERIELLVNRCFILTAKPAEDLWPYDDRLVMSV